MKIEEVSKDRTFTTMCLSELTPDEVDMVVQDHDALADVMEKHGAGNTYTCWKCGYGIYSIRHFGGNILVMIGNSCD
ncbi:MAG: hypothetical protein J6Y60_03405 [Treponema sp.]|nr:hypothetical protein [Treponema sp.]